MAGGSREEGTLSRYLTVVIIALLWTTLAFADSQWVEKRVVASIDRNGVLRVEMTEGEYSYDPNVIVVRVNVPAELTCRKAGGITPHGLVLKAPEANVDRSLELVSEPKSVSFIATKTGKHPFT